MLTVVALLMGPAAAAAQAVTADDGGSGSGGGWSAAPVGGGGRSFVYAEAVPGGVVEDAVGVVNPGERVLVVRLRGTGTGSWITFAQRTVRIPPRTRAELPFTVTVPPGAVPGDHPGAVVVRGGGHEVRVRLQLRVGGSVLAALTVEHVVVHRDHLSYELVNRGTTTLSPKLAVRVDGVLGELVDRPARALPVPLPPGRRVTLTEPWHAPALDSVDVRLTVTADGGAHDTATASARFVPWGALAGVVGGFLAVAAVVFWRLRRRAGAAGPLAGGSADDDAETVREVATVVGAGTGERM